MKLATKNAAQILVVDNDQGFCSVIKRHLHHAGYKAICVSDGVEALAQVECNCFDMVLSEMQMPEMDGVKLLKKIRTKRTDLPFVIVTANGSIDGAVEAIKEGASDYLLKPPNPEELLNKLQICSERTVDGKCNEYRFQNMVSRSSKMRHVLIAARQVSFSPRTTVTVYGESGVGKEVLTKAIHEASMQSSAKFVAVNCAAIPETLLESELFGHVKGAFTGALQDRNGKCQMAHGGTLFLDEIGDMPPALQPKLLRLLEERCYEKVGSDKQIKADFRIVVATHRDLNECCNRGTFRRDLYHRLNIFPITVPPLRDRREDIPQLAEYFLNGLRQHLGKPFPGLSKAALDSLLTYHWPGNVRELRNMLEYACIITNGDLIRPEHLRLQDSATGSVQNNDAIKINLSFSREEFSLEAVNRRVTQWALDRCRNNKSSAARLLKTSRKLFY